MAAVTPGGATLYVVFPFDVVVVVVSAVVLDDTTLEELEETTGIPDGSKVTEFRRKDMVGVLDTLAAVGDDDGGTNTDEDDDDTAGLESSECRRFFLLVHVLLLLVVVEPLSPFFSSEATKSRKPCLTFSVTVSCGATIQKSAPFPFAVPSRELAPVVVDPPSRPNALDLAPS